MVEIRNMASYFAEGKDMPCQNVIIKRMACLMLNQGKSRIEL